MSRSAVVAPPFGSVLPLAARTPLRRRGHAAVPSRPAMLSRFTVAQPVQTTKRPTVMPADCRMSGLK